MSLARRFLSYLLAHKRWSVTLLVSLGAAYVLTFMSLWMPPEGQQRKATTVNKIQGIEALSLLKNSTLPTTRKEDPRISKHESSPSKSGSQQVTAPLQKKNCIPNKNIVFAKTHKCASSAVQNILLRYANDHELTVVLPVLANTHYLSRLRPFSRRTVSNAPWKRFGYNIFCHHTIFEPNEIGAIMPIDSIYITILREPVRLFESLYEYGELRSHYGLTIEEYALATTDPEQTDIIRQRAFGHLGRNQMLFDLGLPQEDFDNQQRIREFVKELDQKFDLIMIAENVDASLVLLKDLLCWNTSDVITLMLNARKKDYRRELSDETVRLLKQWNSGDQILYDHFFNKFEEKIVQFGKERLEKELEDLRKERRYWLDTCIDRTTKNPMPSNPRFRMWSNKVMNFQLKAGIHNSTCENLVKPEITFTNELRVKQIMRLFPFKGVLGSHDAFPVMAQSHLVDVKTVNLSEAVKSLANIYKHKVRALQDPF